MPYDDDRQRHDADLETLLDAVRAERDEGRGVRRALAEHPDLWPLVVELGLEGYAQEVEADVEEEGPDPVTMSDREHGDGACAEAKVPVVRVRRTSRRRASWTHPGFKPSQARRMFAGSDATRPGVVAWSGRAAID